MTNLYKAIAIAIAASLVGCGGGGSNGPPVAMNCVGSLSGGGTTVSVSQACVACSNQDEGKAIDGQANTFALAQQTSGNYSLRATAQTGVLYPAGNFAGALMQIPKSYSPASNWTFSTYKGGVLQESRSATNTYGGDPANPTGADDLYGFTTSKDFDSVGIALSGGSSDTSQSVRVYEFCSRR